MNKEIILSVIIGLLIFHTFLFLFYLIVKGVRLFFYKKQIKKLQKQKSEIVNKILRENLEELLGKKKIIKSTNNEQERNKY